jgi:D-galactarolactone cycloisomerase
VAHGRPLTRIAALLAEGIAPTILGKDPVETESIWSAMFSLTHTRDLATSSLGDGQPHFGGGQTPQLMAAIAGADIALWDLKGKILGEPVARLLGSDVSAVDVYASGGYYVGDHDSERVLREAERNVGLGFRAMKMKIGGLPIADDVERVASVRSAFPELDLMLDANSAYSVPDAIAAARALEPYRIRWLEEPTHWYDPVDGLGQVSQSTTIPTASGESALHRWECRALADRSGIRIMQFDATRAGGVTEWLKVAAYSAQHGILMAPHHDPQIHGHLVAAVENGHILEFFPDPERDPLWFEIYTRQPAITGGVCHLPPEPGFGFEFDWDAVSDRRVGPVIEVRA